MAEGLGVRQAGGGFELAGAWSDLEAVNTFLRHLVSRNFAVATVRAYAYDVLNFARFCVDRDLTLEAVVAVDVFDWIDWQTAGARPAAGNVVKLVRFRGAAPATINRRIAAVRALFEHQVMCGAVAENPVPAPRRGQGLRPKARGMLGHLGPTRPRGGGRLVRQPVRMPEVVDAEDVALFLADLHTHRDRAIVLAMLLGGLRAGGGPVAEVGGCRPGPTHGAGHRQGRPGTHRAGRRAVLRRVGQLPAPGAADGA